MLNDIFSGIKFTLYNYSSNEVERVIASTSHFTNTFIRAKSKIIHLALAFMFSVFFLLIKLPVIATVLAIIAVFKAYQIGFIINAKVELKDHYVFFNKLIEFRDQAWFDMSKQNPTMNMETLKDKARDMHFMNGKTKIPYSDLEGALKIFSVNEEDKPCYETHYMDIFIFTALFDLK